jgi:hypothetical protein
MGIHGSNEQALAHSTGSEGTITNGFLVAGIRTIGADRPQSGLVPAAGMISAIKDAEFAKSI